MNNATTIIVEGIVQKVGFRRFIEQAARGLKLSGYVENLKDGSVKIFVQGENSILEEFVSKIRSPESPGTVENLSRRKSRPLRSLKYFYVKFGNLANELQEGFGGMETQFKDYRADFKDYREEFKDYREEFRDYREEFRGFANRTDTSFKSVDDRYGEISKKLAEILEALRTENRQALIELKETTKALLEAVSKLPGRD